MDPKDNDRLRILKEERVQHIKAIENIDAEIRRIEEGISTEVIEAPSAAPTIPPASVKEAANVRGDITDENLGAFLAVVETLVRQSVPKEIGKFELYLTFTFTPTAKPTFEMTDEGDLEANTRKLLLLHIDRQLVNEMPDTRSMEGPVKFTLRLIFPKI